ncbi:glycosyltransferase family 4 protein [Chromatiaceae bacterium AAb-1]|nr:glycosyltransferase family 4 protein [Chromatiaceae bacterium AAb-1]
MQQHHSNILIISNMGPKPATPFQGLFVQQQVDALSPLAPEYHFMRWHNDSRLNRLFKYPVFIADFFWRFMLRRKKFDLLHVHFFYPTIWLALLYQWCRNPAAKIVVTCHGSDIYKYQPPGKIYCWCAAKVDYWIFSSSKLKAHFIPQVSDSTVLSAGISGIYTDVARLSRSEKTIDLLYAGTLDHNKGMDRLIAMLPALDGKRIVIAGAGNWHAKLQQAVKAYPLVELAGPQTAEGLKQLYRQAKCFISLSRKESFGLVMTEAMACYTPVVATETDGSLEQIMPQQGMLVPQLQDETAQARVMVQAVQTIWQLPDAEYQQMQLAARATAEQYLLPNIVTALQQIYKRVTA